MPRSVKKTPPAEIMSTPQPTSPQKKNSDYVEIRLPKLRFQDTPLSPLWVLLLLIFSFLLGMATTKIQYLESGKGITPTTQAGNQQAAITADTVKKWAKDIRLSSNQFNQCLDTEKYKDTVNADLQDAIAASAEATPTFYINGTRIVGALPYAQFKIAIDKAVNGQQEGPKINVAMGHLPALGKSDAPVTIVEFSDFQCPFCHRFFTDTLPQIKKDYVDTGKVKILYRHLPLSSIHPMAETFANAAECANEQGKFWEMHDKIFKEQA